MSTNHASSSFKPKLLIRAKLIVSAATTVGLALIVALTVSLQYRNVGQATRTERFAHQVIKDIDDLDSMSYAYLLLKDKRPKVQWQLKHTSLGKLLSEDVAANPGEEALIVRLRSNHQRMKDLFDLIVKNIEESHVGAENASPPYDELNEGISAQLLARSEIMLRDASVLTRESAQRMDAVRWRSFLFVVASAFILIVSSSLGSFVLARSIGGSIRKLEHGTQSVASGDLEHRVNVGGGDEISGLAAVFNDMTAKLENARLGLEREIGECKQAEEALKILNQTLEQRVAERTVELAASEQRWATTLASIGDAVIATDMTSGITFLNAVAQVLTGWNREEAVGQPLSAVFRVINEKTLEPREDIAQRALREGSVVALSNNTALITKEGQTIPIEDSAAPIKDREGNITGVVLVFHDVSAKRRAEKALREAHERAAWLAQFPEQNPNPIVRASAAGTVLYCNPATAKHRGWKCEVGLVLRNELLPLVGRAMAERTEVRHDIELDGRFYAVWVAPFSGEGYANLYGRDMTEHKQAEERVSQSQKTFYESVERAPFGIYIVDSQFRIAHMNVGSQDGAFRNVRPVIDRDFAEAMHILWPEPVAAEIIAVFRHTLETGEPYYSPPFINPRHDIGIVESYEWELHRMTLSDGQYGVICYYFDSTKLRTAEAALQQRTLELQHLTETLEERVKERTAELADLSSQLVSAQENERKRVSYDLHDNVWQNLVAIRFDIENLFSGQEDWAALQAKSRKTKEDILNAVGKIRSMQGDLWPYVLDDIGLLATIDWYCREFEKNYSGLDIEKQINLAENEVPSSLKIVVYRLMQETLTNAARHGQANHVVLSLNKNAHRIEFSIKDNGIGFDPEEAIAKKAPWGGLGLLNIKARAELSGGIFGVESVKSKGTTLWASWPV